jgi:hypothetical protein
VQNLLASGFLSKKIKIKIYKTVILPVVLYGCATWSLTLIVERRQMVNEIRVLGRIFGSKKDEVTGEQRKLHNDELNLLYCSPNIVRVIKSRKIRWVGGMLHVWVRGEAYTGFLLRNLRERTTWETQA